MSFGTVILAALGIFGIGCAARAILTGTITFVFARLVGGIGPDLTAEFDRDAHPVGFWTSIAVYGGGGLFLLGFALVRAIVAQP